MKPLLFALLAAVAAPALAAPEAPVRAAPAAKPAVLDAEQRSRYREVLAALRADDWTGAAARLDAMPAGPLHHPLRAELFLAKNSPEAPVDQLLALLAAAPDLPDAEQLARLAARRGAVETPALPSAQKLIWQGTQPRRARPKSVRGDPAAAALEAAIQPLIVDNQPQAAEALLLAEEARLGSEALAEFRQRIAWSYYIVGDDGAARRLADLARSAGGEWALQAAWTSGLAAWRQGDCRAAADAFATVGAAASDPELFAAGNYWAARAETRCQRPERVQQRLRTAARLKETFYGLLAARALGIKSPGFAGLHDYRDAEWRAVAARPNVRAAIAWAELGETALAHAHLRREAELTGPREHHALLHLASDLALTGTQFWLAHNAPRGAQVNPAARYPAPDWAPSRGWRVDPSLAFAHALQESNFRTEVVSPAGAVGLMQVMPGTAGDVARKRGETFSRDQLVSPPANLEYGQSYLEYLRDYPATGGLLPKVIAAYNAGPAPVAEWNTRAIDRGDPLLYIESLPYWETRGYVPTVLRNYWIYEAQAGRLGPSRTALVQGMWPRFPGMKGATAVRLASDRPPVRVTPSLGTE